MPADTGLEVAEVVDLVACNLSDGADVALVVLEVVFIDSWAEVVVVNRPAAAGLKMKSFSLSLVAAAAVVCVVVMTTVMVVVVVVVVVVAEVVVVEVAVVV